MVLFTELIKCWLATLKSCKADVLSISPSQSELGTLLHLEQHLWYFFVLLPSYKHCKGQWRQLLTLCYLLFRCCQTWLLCSPSLKKTINIGSWTVSFMLTFLSYWNTQGVAFFHRFHFKHNVPTNFLRKQSL